MFGSIVRVRQAPGANVLLGTLALCAVIFAVSPDGGLGADARGTQRSYPGRCEAAGISSQGSRGLEASGPPAELAGKMMLFGQFVGDWEFDSQQRNPERDRQTLIDRRTGRASL
jgi:hypothetical protein